MFIPVFSRGGWGGLTAAPLVELLTATGVPCQAVEGHGVTVVVPACCPLCGQRAGEGPVCAVAERPEDGGYLHSEFECCRGPSCSFEVFLNRAGAAPAARPSAALSPAGEVAALLAAGTARTGEGPGEASEKNLAQRKAALRACGPAVRWLREGCRLSGRTTERFHLVLQSALSTPENGRVADVLGYPLMGPDGEPRKKFGYLPVPGLTSVERGQFGGLMRGEGHVYYGAALAGQRRVVVVDAAADLWALSQLMEADAAFGAGTLLVCAVGGEVVPAEWRNRAWWAGWEEIFLAHAAGKDRGAAAASELLRRLGGRGARRAMVPEKLGQTWADFLVNLGTAAEFAAVLAAAPAADVLVYAPAGAGGGPVQAGLHARAAVDINSGYAAGRLYYPVSYHEVVEAGRDAEGRPRYREHYSTYVVRSDRTRHQAIASELPPGAPRHAQRVLRLTDGTVISSHPSVSEYHSWGTDSIEAYLRGGTCRPLGEILREVAGCLRAAVWLPNFDDHAVLTCLLAATYVVQAFEAVPYVLLHGPAGSGKSAAGEALSLLGYNGSLSGQSSAATVARQIDDSRGFVFFDDLEELGAARGSDAASFSLLVQCLKVGYKKATANKRWTDMKAGRVLTLNFYGIKAFGNTRGVDDILGSRCVVIRTMRKPAGTAEVITGLTGEVRLRMAKLRDELHVWAFENIGRVERLYAERFAQRSDRDAEIQAPLRLVAELAEDTDLAAMLDRALAHANYTAEASSTETDLSDLLHDAVRELAVAGYRWIAPIHVVMHLANLTDPNAGRKYTNEVLEHQDSLRVGRLLRVEGILDERDEGAKPRLSLGRQVRVYPIRRAWLEQALADVRKTGATVAEAHTEATQALTFCEEQPVCAGCPYERCQCPYRDEKEAVRERRRHLHHRRTGALGRPAA